MSAKISVAFHLYDRSANARPVHWMTKLQAFLAGEIVHVDVMFDSRQGSPVTSIMMDETVHLTSERRLSNPDKKFMELSLSLQEEQQLYNFASHHAHAKTPFSKSGYYRCLLPFGLHKKTDDTEFFCAQYICRMFQQINMCKNLDAGKCTPNMLYSDFVTSGRFVATIPPKLREPHIEPVTTTRPQLFNPVALLNQPWPGVAHQYTAPHTTRKSALGDEVHLFAGVEMTQMR